MSILADGTIKRTIRKQAGHGPFLWVVIAHEINLDGMGHESYVYVFSFSEDASKMCDALQANGHAASIELATDHCRTFSPKGKH